MGASDRETEGAHVTSLRRQVDPSDQHVDDGSDENESFAHGKASPYLR
jgi:hypothetical protein